MNKHCRNCHYWVRIDGSTGECRAVAPFMIDKDYNAIWPKTDEKDWCGNWKVWEKVKI